jgi:hypothetical protein
MLQPNLQILALSQFQLSSLEEATPTPTACVSPIFWKTVSPLFQQALVSWYLDRERIDRDG